MTAKLRGLTAGEHAGGGLRCGSGRAVLPAVPQPVFSAYAPRMLHHRHHPTRSLPWRKPCSERVAAVSTLATFLSYLTFTRTGGCSGAVWGVQLVGRPPARQLAASSRPQLLLPLAHLLFKRGSCPRLQRRARRMATAAPAAPVQPTTAATRWTQRQRWRARRLGRARRWPGRCPGWFATCGFSSGTLMPRGRPTSGAPGWGLAAAGCCRLLLAGLPTLGLGLSGPACTEAHRCMAS